MLVGTTLKLLVAWAWALFFISLYSLVANLLDVGNSVCFLEHTMVSHRTMVPM
jgi:hypothetical protein